MKLLEVLVITSITLIVFAAETKGINGGGRCGSQGDIVFVLDESGSIGLFNFNGMISFVKDIVKKFVVNKNQIQFGLMTYSYLASTDFRLNTYSDTQSILNALSRVRYIGGTTNTAWALEYLRKFSFSYKHGHRPGVPKLAIVITDGASDSLYHTRRQAVQAHSSGIKIMAIGVGGGTNKRELHDIASDPDSEFLLELDSFSALSAIQNHLRVADTVCRGINGGRCGSQADIMFVLDESGSIGLSNFNSMLSFVKDIVKMFVVNKNQIQFGLVTYSSSASTDFQLNTYSDEQSILNALGRVVYSGGATNTAGALQYLRISSFSSLHGHRPGVPKLAIVITDGASNNYQETKKQAQLAHSGGIKIMAIGVGGGTNKQELGDIASDPDSKFLFDLNSFSALGAIKNHLADILCREVW